ncbi:MAG: hypothetical protein KDC87_07655, partial [Planctomycetes bacterium]|nr:hypothetical protein [Planctomycetota bacterium]
QSGPACSSIFPPSHSGSLRVGVEYLPLGEGCAALVGQATGSETDPACGTPALPTPSQAGLVVSSLRPDTPPPRYEPLGRASELQVRWELGKEAIRATRDPYERVTLRFLAELVGDDRKRVQRTLGAPLLNPLLRPDSHAMSNYLDERDDADQQRLLTEHGRRMIRRPMRNAVRELPLVHDVETAVREFKEHNVDEPQRRSSHFGRISLRARLSSDPLEVAWILGGARIGTSMNYLRTSYTAYLTSNLSLRLRGRYDYRDSEWRLFGSAVYEHSETTSVHALLGNHIDILSGPTSYPGGPQSEEPGQGVLVYVEHHF